MTRTRVLFVCIGNSCRSPMAEGFARFFGSDVLTAQSAGLAPAMIIAPLTHRVMLEKNIDLGDAYPKGIDHVKGDVDLIINLSGQPIPINTGAPVDDWEVRDPIGESEDVFREVRDEIEQRVIRLVLAIRARKPPRLENRKEPAPRVDTRSRTPRQ